MPQIGNHYDIITIFVERSVVIMNTDSIVMTGIITIESVFIITTERSTKRMPRLCIHCGLRICIHYVLHCFLIVKKNNIFFN